MARNSGQNDKFLVNTNPIFCILAKKTGQMARNFLNSGQQKLKKQEAKFS